MWLTLIVKARMVTVPPALWRVTVLRWADGLWLSD
jgi:hypothetical protein